jgi:hypothetical protein
MKQLLKPMWVENVPAALQSSLPDSRRAVPRLAESGPRGVMSLSPSIAPHSLIWICHPVCDYQISEP